MAFLSQNPTAAQQNHTGSSQMLVDAEKLGRLQSFQTSSVQVVWRLAGVQMQGGDFQHPKKIQIRSRCTASLTPAMPCQSGATWSPWVGVGGGLAA
jgi:hypothetical protein